MDNEMMIFTNPEFGEVRTLTISGEPWFVGKDVTGILGYTNSRKALTDHVDAEDKGVTKCDTLGGTQNVTIINESGVYSLIMSSKLPTAKKFKRWVTSEVLPAIRKHGVYAVDKVLEDPDMLINALLEYKAERERRRTLEAKAAAQALLIEEMKPKVTYYDVVLNCPDVVTVNTIAKDYGKSAIWLNKWLHEHKVQYKQGKMWHPYQKYAKKGYTKTKTLPIPDGGNGSRSHTHTYWTQKGRIFIYNLLKENSILPLIEQETAD